MVYQKAFLGTGKFTLDWLSVLGRAPFIHTYIPLFTTMGNLAQSFYVTAYFGH